MSCLPPVKGIPYDFNGCLSLESRYVILAQYVCEMKKNIEELTNAFNQVQDYVNNYFNNLDVQDEINNKLDNMAESGELYNVFSVTAPNNITPSYKATYYKKVTDNTLPCEMEAVVAIGNNQFVCFLSPIEYSDSTACIITKVQINPTGSGYGVQEISNNTANGLGHCNDATYFNGLIYVATYLNTIVSVNPSTLEIVNTYNFNYNITNICNDGTTLYTYINDNKSIYEINLETKELTLKCLIQYPYLGVQSIAYNSGMFWLFNNDHLTVSRFTTSGSFVSSSQINDTDDNNHSFNYIAGTDFYNGILYAVFNKAVTRTTGNAYTTSAENIGEIANYLCTLSQNVYNYGKSSQFNLIGNAYVENFSDGWSYSTGSSSAPYKSINEAINNNNNIVLKENVSVNGLLNIRNKNVTISGGNIMCNGVSIVSSNVTSQNSITINSPGFNSSYCGIIFNSVVNTNFINGNATLPLYIRTSIVIATNQNVASNIDTISVSSIVYPINQNVVTISSPITGQLLYASTESGTVFSVGYHITNFTQNMLVNFTYDGTQYTGLVNRQTGNNTNIGNVSLSINTSSNVWTFGQSIENLSVYML